MKSKKINILIITVLIISMIGITGCKPWTIVKNGEQKSSEENKVYFANSDFDVNSYVKDIWDNQLFSYYEQKQKDISVVITEITKDVNEAGESYGFGGSAQGSTWSFVVSGKGKIIEVNQESRVGIMTVDLEPFDQIADVMIQIGPIIKGSSIRDTIDTIKLDNFENQVQYASISKAFNERILSDVTATIDATMVGKEVQFLGAFQYNSPEEIIITPVKIEIDGGK